MRRNVEAGAAAKGDVVQFEYRGVPVAGRVVRVKKDGTRTVEVDLSKFPALAAIVRDDGEMWIDIRPAGKAQRNAILFMMYAQPYSPSATGWYFKDIEDFEKKYKKHLPVEEYELQLVDAEHADFDLFKAMRVNQANLREWFEVMDKLDSEHDQAAFYYLAEDLRRDDWEDMLTDVDREVRVMEGDTKAYAENYIDDMGGVGQLGKKTIEMYFDYERFGADLEHDLDPDDEGDQYYLDMTDQKRGEEYVDSIGFESLGETAENYFDMDAFARDLELGGDVTEFEFAGKTWTTDYHG